MTTTPTRKPSQAAHRGDRLRLAGLRPFEQLEDSGCDVVVGLRSDSPSVAKAQSAGWRFCQSLTPPNAGHRNDADAGRIDSGIYKREIEPHLKPGKYLAVAHGFSIRYGNRSAG